MMSNIEFLGIKYIEDNQTATLNAAGTEQIQLQPPKGYVYKLIDLYFTAPAMAGSDGNHKVYLYNNSIGFSPFYGFMVGTSSITLYQTSWLTAMGTEHPANSIDQISYLNNNIWASYENPYTFDYRNETDANQTGTRKYNFLVQVFKEVLE